MLMLRPVYYFCLVLPVPCLAGISRPQQLTAAAMFVYNLSCLFNLASLIGLCYVACYGT